MTFRKKMFFISLFLVILAIIGGFFITGGPKYQRKVLLDSKRAKIINNLSKQINFYYKEHKKIPEDLHKLQAIKNNLLSYIDPETKSLPEYKIISNDKFKLCMTFSTSNISVKDKKNYANYHYYYKKIKHKAGYHCTVYYKNIDKYGQNKFKLIN